MLCISNYAKNPTTQRQSWGIFWNSHRSIFPLREFFHRERETLVLAGPGFSLWIDFLRIHTIIFLQNENLKTNILHTLIRCINVSWSWDLLRIMEGFLWFSVVPTVRGEGELAFLSRSEDLVSVCWNTLGDSRTEDAAEVVAGTRGGPATCRGTMVILHQRVWKPAARPRVGDAW